MDVGLEIGGKFRLIRLIGEGGMGTVWEARHIEIGRKVALKFLLPAVESNPEIVSRFLLEAKAAAAIGSEHIVDVFDVGRSDDGTPFIVMEYLEGKSLRENLNSRGQFHVPEALEIIAPIFCRLRGEFSLTCYHVQGGHPCMHSSVV